MGAGEWIALVALALTVLGSASAVFMRLGAGNQKLDALEEAFKQLHAEMLTDRREMRRRNSAVWKKLKSMEERLKALEERE